MGMEMEMLLDQDQRCDPRLRGRGASRVPRALTTKGHSFSWLDYSRTLKPSRHTNRLKVQ